MIKLFHPFLLNYILIILYIHLFHYKVDSIIIFLIFNFILIQSFYLTQFTFLYNLDLIIIFLSFNFILLSSFSLTQFNFFYNFLANLNLFIIFLEFCYLKFMFINFILVYINIFLGYFYLNIIIFDCCIKIY